RAVRERRAGCARERETGLQAASSAVDLRRVQRDESQFRRFRVERAFERHILPSWGSACERNPPSNVAYTTGTELSLNCDGRGSCISGDQPGAEQDILQSSACETVNDACIDE